MRHLAVAAVLVAGLAVDAAAQAAPRAGQWGAEMPVSGASGSLLRFSSPTRAWMFGLSAINLAVSTSSGLTGSDDHEAFVFAHVGRRWYRTASRPVRPFFDLALTGGFSNHDHYAAGFFTEFGASYFLTDRLNVGALGFFRAAFDRRRESGGFSAVTFDVFDVRLTGPHLTVGFLF